MNMSGNYTGQYYQLFGQPNQPVVESPTFRRHYPGDYELFPPNLQPSPQPEYVPEYNLWGASPYNPAELIHPARNPAGMFGNLHPSPPCPPPYPPPVQFRPVRLDVPPPIPPLPLPMPSPITETIPPMPLPMPSPITESIPPMPLPMPSPIIENLEESKQPEEVSKDAVTQSEGVGAEAVGDCEEPELTGLEVPEKIVIDRKDLFLEDADAISDSEENDAVERASSSSSSSSGDWTNSNFQRAGAYPPSYPWASRPSRVVNNRGRKANIMQRRLVRALSQPVQMDKGASMLQRMGWAGGGLGRDGSGIVDPVTPNAVYATSTVGFGQDSATKKSGALKSKRNRISPKYPNKCMKGIFISNVLEKLLEFMKNDLSYELYFDTKLKNKERKRIHKVVDSLHNEESVEIYTPKQQKVIDEILLRKHYCLTTQSDGEGEDRQICVYKSAPSHVFLVTPDDCRPCITEIKEVEEESNPFLKSITNHIRKDEGTIIKPKPPNLLDKLVQFFMDFCADEGFTEFRCLGPFTDKEVFVVNNFFNLIIDVGNEQKPYFKCPVELLDAFVADYKFLGVTDPNGFTAIKKVPFNLKEEYEKQQEEKKAARKETSISSTNTVDLTK